MEKRSFFSKIFGKKRDEVKDYSKFEMLSGNNNITSWNGRVFDNDIVRSAIRPKANAVGKLNAKHIRGEGEKMKINPNPKVKYLLTRPNRYMSMQDFLMKMTFQRELNHNAFAYVKRDELGYPKEIFPIPYNRLEILELGENTFVRFYFDRGKHMAVHYDDLIHLRKDFYKNDLLGDDGRTAITNIMEVVDTTDRGLIQAIKDSNVIRWILRYNQTLRPEDIKSQTKEFVDTYLSIDSEIGGAIGTDVKAELDQVEPKNYVPNYMQNKGYIERVNSYFGVNESIIQNKYDEEEWNAFYESEVEPIAIQLSNEFTKIIFTQKEIGHGNKIIFESSNLMYASSKTKLELVSMVDRGALTPNEWRAVLGFAPIENGSKPIRRLDTAEVKKDNKGGDEEDDYKTDGENKSE